MDTVERDLRWDLRYGVQLFLRHSAIALKYATWAGISLLGSVCHCGRHRCSLQQSASKADGGSGESNLDKGHRPNASRVL